MAIFFGIAFGVPWGTWIALQVRHSSFAQGPPLAWMVGAAFCSVAGIVATYVETGLSGVKDLARRCVLYRVSVSWWLYACLVPLGVHLLATIIYGASQGRLGPFRPLTLFHQWWLFYVFAFGLLQGALAEELGWRGFLLPRLLRTHSPLSASVILGIVWAAWHINMFSSPASTLALFTASAIALSILMTVMFLHTRGSVLLAIVMHWSGMPGKDFARISFPSAAEPPDWLRAAVLIALSVIVIAVGGKRLTGEVDT